MIAGYMPHWWSIKYNAKYLVDIRERKPITKETVWDQLVIDFWLTDQAEKSAVFDDEEKHDELLDWIDKIVENRVSEEDGKRTRMEYYYRSRILNLFPSSLEKYLKIKSSEIEEYVGEIEMSEKMQEIVSKYKPKPKTNSGFKSMESIFKG